MDKGIAQKDEGAVFGVDAGDCPGRESHLKLYGDGWGIPSLFAQALSPV